MFGVRGPSLLPRLSAATARTCRLRPSLAPVAAPRSTEKSPGSSSQTPQTPQPSRAVMASIFQAFPQLRTAAPRLTRRLFVCRPCLNSPIRAASPARSSAPRPSVLQSVRWKSTQPLRSSATASATNVEGSMLAEAAAKSGGKSSSWPNTSSKGIAYWLLGSAASVFGIVIFGGLTRLTESGYATTDSKLSQLLTLSA